MIRSVLIVMVLISEIMFYGIAGAEDPFGKINRGMDAKHTPVIEAPDSVKAGEPFQVTVGMSGPGDRPDVSVLVPAVPTHEEPVLSHDGF